MIAVLYGVFTRCRIWQWVLVFSIGTFTTVAADDLYHACLAGTRGGTAGEIAYSISCVCLLANMIPAVVAHALYEIWHVSGCAVVRRLDSSRHWISVPRGRRMVCGVRPSHHRRLHSPLSTVPILRGHGCTMKHFAGRAQRDNANAASYSKTTL